MSDGLASRAWRAISGGGSAGAANAIPRVTAGIAQSVWANLGAWLHTAGVGVSLSPVTATMPESVGVGLLATYGGSTTPAQGAGIAQSVTADLGTPAQSTGARIVQVTYDLVQDLGSS